MADAKLFNRDETFIGNTYHRLPIAVSKAKGSWIFDNKNRKYLDMLTGIAVLPLGHLHPDVKKAINAQLAKYTHLSNYFADQSQVDLAELIVNNSFADKVFYANTGAEATELAIKMARKWAGIHRRSSANEIISMEQSFHGRTMGAISLTGQPRFHEGIKPIMKGVKTVPYNDISAVKRAINRRTAAIIVEPVQCEGGINIPQIDYLTQLKHLCKKHNILLIVDEIQTGLGRTGRFLASEHSLTLPDIVLLAKSLGGGFPLSAVAVTDAVASVISYGDHGTTMGGNPVACAAGYATLKHVLDNKLIENAEKLGDTIKEELFRLSEKNPLVTRVRNLGCIIGFDHPYAALLVEEARSLGLLVNKVQECTIRLLPPLNMSGQEVKFLITTLEKVLKKLEKKHRETTPVMEEDA